MKKAKCKMQNTAFEFVWKIQCGALNSAFALTFHIRAKKISTSICVSMLLDNSLATQLIATHI